MSKKDFIALADLIKSTQAAYQWTPDQILVLAEFCRSQNSQFKRDRWLGYIAGACGPNGGKVMASDSPILSQRVRTALKG